jgi:hypothetical protein
VQQMVFRWRAALLSGSAIMAISGAALAQTPPPAPARPAAAQPLYNPDQLPVLRGRVQQFTLTPRGDIDGLILTNGTEVDTPPYLSTEIAYAIKPGDMVTIHGLHAAALPLVRAVSVTDDATRRTVRHWTAQAGTRPCAASTGCRANQHRRTTSGTDGGARQSADRAARTPRRFERSIA